MILAVFHAGAANNADLNTVEELGWEISRR